MFQIIIRVLAIILTFKYYIKKFPLCSVALIARFLKSFVNSKGDCQKAADMWEQKTYNKIQSNYERRA